MYGVTLIVMVPAPRGLPSPRAPQPGRAGDPGELTTVTLVDESYKSGYGTR
jgi:hypothetical protein